MEKVVEAGPARSLCSLVESIVIDDSSSENDVTVQEDNLKRTNKQADSQDGPIEIIEPDQIKSAAEFFASYLQDWFSISQTDFQKMKLLNIMMDTYKTNTKPWIEESKSRPNKAFRLKTVFVNTLQSFHVMRDEMMHSEYERKSYLKKMSDFLTTYMDLEITSSRTGVESCHKIASKITSALFLYLDEEKLILDTVMKSNCLKRNYSELWKLIFSRILREFPSSSTSVNMNLRYIFAFRLWESVTSERYERKNILHLAKEKLCPHPALKNLLTSKNNKFKGIFPKISKNCDNVIKFLLKAKFPVQERAKRFIKYLNQSEQDSLFYEDNSYESSSIQYSSEDESKSSSNGSQSTEDSENAQCSGVSKKIKTEKRKNHAIRKRDIWTNILKGSGRGRDKKRKRNVVKESDQNNNKSQIELSHQSDNCDINITQEKVKTENDIDSDSAETSGTTSSAVTDTTVKNECENNLQAVPDKSFCIKNEPKEMASNSLSDIDNTLAVNECVENLRASPESISPNNGKVQVKNENLCESTDINSSATDDINIQNKNENNLTKTECSNSSKETTVSETNQDSLLVASDTFPKKEDQLNEIKVTEENCKVELQIFNESSTYIDLTLSPKKDVAKSVKLSADDVNKNSNLDFITDEIIDLIKEEDDSAKIKANEEGKPSVGESHDFDMVDTLNQCINDLDEVSALIIDESYSELNTQISSSPGKDLLFVNNTECNEICVAEDCSPEENLPTTSEIREVLPTIINLMSDDEEDNKQSAIINKKHALDLGGENCESSIDIEDLLGGIQVSEVSESTPSLSKDIGELCKKSEGSFDWPTSSSDASNLVDKDFCTSSITTGSTTYTTTSINYSTQNNRDTVHNYEIPGKISSSSLQDNNSKAISNMNNKSDSFAQASHFFHVDKNVDCSNENSAQDLFSAFSSAPINSCTTSVTNAISTSMPVNNSTLSIAEKKMSPNVVNGFNTDKAGITSSISDIACVTCNSNTMLNDSLVYKQQTFPTPSSKHFSFTNYSPSKENDLTKSNANNVDFTADNLYITPTTAILNEPAICAQQNIPTALSRNGSATNSMQTDPFVGNSHQPYNIYNNPFVAMEYNALNNAFPTRLPQYPTPGIGHISGEHMALNNFPQVSQRFKSPSMHNMYNYSYAGIRPNYSMEMRPRSSTINKYRPRASLNTMNSFGQNTMNSFGQNTMNSFGQNYVCYPQNALNRDFITPASQSLISAGSSRQNPAKRGNNKRNASGSHVYNPSRQSSANRNCNSTFQFPQIEYYESSKVPVSSHAPDLSFQMLNPNNQSLVPRNCRSSFHLPRTPECYGWSKVPLNSSISNFNHKPGQLNNCKASSIDNTKHSFMGLSKGKNLPNSSNSPEVSSSTDKSINENEALKNLLLSGDISVNTLQGNEHNESIKSPENNVVHSTKISEQNSSSLPDCSSSPSNKTLKALINSGDISLNPVNSNVNSRKNTPSAPGNLDSFGSKNKYYTDDTTTKRNETTESNSSCSEVLDYSFSKNDSSSDIPHDVPKPANNENSTEKDLMNFLNNSLNYIPNSVMAKEQKNVHSSKPLVISSDPNILQTHPKNKSNLEKETESSSYDTLSPHDSQSCLESGFVSETINGTTFTQSSHIPKEIANKKLFQLRFRPEEIKHLKTTFDFHLEEVPTNPPSKVHYDAYYGGMFIQVFGFSFYVPDAFEYFMEIKTKFLTDYSHNYNRINNMYHRLGSLNPREDMNKTNSLHTLTLKKDYSLFQIQNKLSVNIDQSIFQLQSVLYTFNKEPRCTCVLCGGNNITLLANNSMLEALHVISLVSKNIPCAESTDKSDILILPMTENCSKKLESGDTSILPLKKRRTSNSESYPWNDGKEIMMSIASFHSPIQSYVPQHMQDSYPQYYAITENLKDNFADLVEHCRNACIAMQRIEQEIPPTQHQYPANQPLDGNHYEPSTKLEDFVLPESQGYVLCKDTDTPFNGLRGQYLNDFDVPSTSGSRTGNVVITSPSENRRDGSNLPRNVSSAIKIPSNIDKSLYYMIPKQKQSYKRKSPMQTKNPKRPRKNKQ